ITTGDPIDGRAAAALGLVDLLIEDQLLAAALPFAHRTAARRPLPRASRRSDLLSVPVGFVDDSRARLARRSRGAQAPPLALDAVTAALQLPFDRGLERERELWAEAAASPEAEAMRYIFRAERAAAKVPDLAEDDLAGVGLVIEALVEDRGTKRE